MPRLPEEGVGGVGQLRVESKAAEPPTRRSAMEGMRKKTLSGVGKYSVGLELHPGLQRGPFVQLGSRA